MNKPKSNPEESVIKSLCQKEIKLDEEADSYITAPNKEHDEKYGNRKWTDIMNDLANVWDKLKELKIRPKSVYYNEKRAKRIFN